MQGVFGSNGKEAMSLEEAMLLEEDDEAAWDDSHVPHAPFWGAPRDSTLSL